MDHQAEKLRTRIAECTLRSTNPFQIAEEANRLAMNMIRVSGECTAKAHVYKSKQNTKESVTGARAVARRDGFIAISQQLIHHARRLERLSSQVGGGTWSSTVGLRGTTNNMIEVLAKSDAGITNFMTSIGRHHTAANSVLVKELQLARYRCRVLEEQLRTLASNFKATYMNLALVSSRKVQLYYTGGVTDTGRAKERAKPVMPDHYVPIKLNAFGHSITEAESQAIYVAEQL
eukprot:TRINITY_DN17424_c0_g2_i2.p1 TRINITY_DN17424_c0_g2~~TRINITY_DN17424_c0_g2_i2.p1  ORF type:complete len:233 (-),score=43.53 TRINITY_DN17424_c0_g2_i2:177-875(-)